MKTSQNVQNDTLLCLDGSITKMAAKDNQSAKIKGMLGFWASTHLTLLGKARCLVVLIHLTLPSSLTRMSKVFLAHAARSVAVGLSRHMFLFCSPNKIYGLENWTTDVSKIEFYCCKLNPGTSKIDFRFLKIPESSSSFLLTYPLTGVLAAHQSCRRSENLSIQPQICSHRPKLASCF